MFDAISEIMNKVFLSLGSNLGDRALYLSLACDALQHVLYDMRVSRIYETEPMYKLDQPNFLNMVIGGETSLSATEVFSFIKSLEYDIGRVRLERNGPRQIDIDVIGYNQEIIELSELIIPHPRYHERLFVLEPLRDVEPHWICPRTGLSLDEMIQKLH